MAEVLSSARKVLLPLFQWSRMAQWFSVESKLLKVDYSFVMKEVGRGTPPSPPFATLLNPLQPSTTLQPSPSPDPPTTNHLSGLLKDFDDDISFYSYYRPSDLNENKDEAEETVPEVIPKWNIDHSIFRARKFGESDRYVPKMFVAHHVSYDLLIK